MESVNKRLLDALKGLLELHDNPAPFSGKTGEDRILMLERQAAKSHALIYSARQAIAAAEQAQQAEPVARDVLMAFGIDVLVQSGSSMRESDLAAIVDRHATQPPAVAVPGEMESIHDTPFMSADTEPEIAYRDGWNACRAAMLAAAPQAAVSTGWIDPNDKTQKQFLPHIGETVLFCHDGVTYYGVHTGGSFKTGHGITARTFGTWDCLWMYPQAAAQKGGA